MEEPVSDVVPGHPVPAPHQHIDLQAYTYTFINNIGNIWGGNLFLNTLLRINTTHETHKDKIMEPW